jgi:predicted ribosome quality control (RQC) complex YloA/Tae2 family protein
LESLLDAGTLALWFSKARGRPRAEVLWTPRKHVRKPKGLAPGKVEVVRSKTLLIDFEKERLARLLATGKADA